MNQEISNTTSYVDYKKFINILTDHSSGTKSSINPLPFFTPSEVKIDYSVKDELLNSFFNLRAIKIPLFNIIDKQFEKYNRFEDFTKKDEVNNLALWILSAFQYKSHDLKLGKELEIFQENNPRDGRLDVVAIKGKKICVIETKTDLRTLLSENKFAFQISGYKVECLKCSKEKIDSEEVLVLLAVGGEETDLFPPGHLDSTTGAVGNISKIFYDKLQNENIKFISANALWAFVSYKYLTNADLDLFDFINKIFSDSNVIGLLSGGIVKKISNQIEIEKINIITP